jgi:hypothetical protein
MLLWGTVIKNFLYGQEEAIAVCCLLRLPSQAKSPDNSAKDYAGVLCRLQHVHGTGLVSMLV